MADTPSPILLMSYIAAASREVLEDRPLSARSAWAVEHAAQQLATRRAVLRASDRRAAPQSRGAVVSTASDRGPQLASLLLGAEASARDGDSTQELKRATADVAALLDGNKAAASRLTVLLDDAAARLTHAA